jgi:hypothetical protein
MQKVSASSVCGNEIGAGGVTMTKFYLATFMILLFAVSAFTEGWDKQINAPNRFKVLAAFNNEAVLDKETGLVWQKVPIISDRSWFAAWKFCQLNITGNRAGWRLPTLEELRSLIDPQQSEPALPPGNPFTDVVTQNFWSATAGFTSSNAVISGFQFGEISETDKSNLAANTWCVRGGYGYDTNNP